MVLTDISGCWYPPQACVDHWHLRRPSPPEHQRGVPRRQRRAPEVIQVQTHPFPPQDQVPQEGRCVRRRGQEREGRLQHCQIRQRCSAHQQQGRNQGGQGVRLPQHRQGIQEAARRQVRGEVGWCPGEEGQGQGRGEGRKEIDVVFIFLCSFLMRFKKLVSWLWDMGVVLQN